MNKGKSGDFRLKNLVFIDIETTGLNPEEHEIIEIGCLVVNGQTFEVKTKYHARINPKHPDRWDTKAKELIGYSRRKWSNTKELSNILNKINKLSSGGILAGWNVSFDWSFLRKAFEHLSMTPQFDYHRIDVMSIAYAALYLKPKVESLSLRKVAVSFGMSLPETHRAMDDIKATYEIFKKIMKNEK